MEVGEIIVGTIDTVSSISCLLLIYAHFIIPSMMKHPGSVILTEGIILFLFHTLMAILSFFFDNIQSTWSCSIMVFMIDFLLFNVPNYMAILGLELIIKHKYPLVIYYRKRMIFYHFICLSVSLVFSVYSI